jgi:Gram-negative porin
MAGYGKAGWLSGAVLAAMTASAFGAPADWTLAPLRGDFGDVQMDIGAAAGGSLFTTNRPGQPAASGYAKLMPRLHRDYDSGLSVGLDATLSASDPLSRGRYGDGVEKLYAEIRTGLGRLELGQTDGGAYGLAVTGPKVDADISLDNPQTSFFRDPATGRAFTNVFPLRTEIGASSNDAKIAYVSPSVFGAQLALSYTPNEAKEVLPFLHAGPHLAGRAAAIWEGSARYSGDIGPVTLTGYAGLAEGRAEHKLPGQHGLSDWGAGLRADYPVNDDVTISAGGAYRRSNSHGFDVNQSWHGGSTSVTHLSASVTDGDIVAGVEYGSGTADAVAALPHLGLNAYQASVGYTLSSSVQISAGWQGWVYSRSSGLFFNAAPRIRLSAGFLHLSFHTSP